MLERILVLSIIILAVSALLALYRAIRGPSMPDRVIALDTIGINVIGIAALLSIYLKTHAFVPFILMLGILAFIGTVAFSKFLERGEVIEHSRD